MTADGVMGDVETEIRTSAHTWCQGACLDEPHVQAVVSRVADLTQTPETNAEYAQLVYYHACDEAAGQKCARPVAVGGGLAVQPRPPCSCPPAQVCLLQAAQRLYCGRRAQTPGSPHLHAVHLSERCAGGRWHALHGPALGRGDLPAAEGEGHLVAVRGDSLRLEHVPTCAHRVRQLAGGIPPLRKRALCGSHATAQLNDAPHNIDERTNHEALPVTKGEKFGANFWIHQHDFKGSYKRGCTAG